MESAADLFSTWVALPLNLQLLNLLIAASTFSFLLLALFFFIRAIRPSVTTKEGHILSFFFRKKRAENLETPISVACIDARASLLNHRFFRMMRSIQTAGFFQLDDPEYIPKAKDIINLVFLRDCKFKVFKEGMTIFVKEIEEIEDPKAREDRVQSFPSKVSDLVAQYEAQSHDLKIILPNDSILYGVPSVYMTKFNKWHSEHTAMCLDSINDVLGDKLYEDWYAELRACLDFLYIAFELTIQDARLTLRDLNGDLDGEIAKILENRA